MSSPFQQGNPASRAPQGKQKKQSSGGFLSNLFGGGKTYLVLAIIAGLGAAFIALLILGQSAERATYYVLNQDVPARTQILNDMLVPIETSAGSQPFNALNPADLIEPVFTKVPLSRGDVITPTTVGPLQRIDANLPDDYVVASFSAEPVNAVAGKIRRGDLVDVIALTDVNNVGVARVVLRRLLILDVTTDPSTISQGATDSSVENVNVDPGPESNAVRGGIPQIYTVAVTPEDAAKIALLRNNDLFIVLSSNTSEEVGLDVSVSETDIFGIGDVGNSSEGIDVDAIINGTEETVQDGTTGDGLQPVDPTSPAADGSTPAPSGSTATSSPQPSTVEGQTGEVLPSGN